MDEKTCEVAFDQDNGIAYIAKYTDYKESEDKPKLDVELYNPMTGERVHKFKLLFKHLDTGDEGENHANYRFPVIIKQGESMYLSMPRLSAIRRGDQKDPPVFATWQIVKSEEEKKNESMGSLDDFITPIEKKLPTLNKL